MDNKNFQINLRGIIDLLSNHLYSSPHTYLRELLQNGADAIAARKALKEKFEPEMVFELSGGALPTLLFEDNGIGLTEEEIHRFLATIGESSKRMESGEAGPDFIGQFGIGLLSCFVVADEIVMVTRSAKGGAGYEWRGRVDGTYSVKSLGADLPVGTRVFLRCKPGSEEFFAPQTVADRVAHYGDLLPVPVYSARGGARIQLNTGSAPWQKRYASPREETKALLDWGRKILGVPFLDAVSLRSARGGVEGAAFVLPFASGLQARQPHRVYLKGMLLTESAQELLPEWAFFVRCAVNATKLRPTASREGFYPDTALEKTRQELGECLRAYLFDLAKLQPAKLEELISVHSRAIKALAVEDEEFFKVISDFLPFETSHGTMSLGELRRRERVLRYAPHIDQFRQISGVAAAQGLCVVNAGYAWDGDLLERAGQLHDGLDVRPINASELVQEFEDLSKAERDAAFDFLREADTCLRAFGCMSEARKFLPAEMPALYSLSAEGEFRRSLERSKEVSSELWSGVLNGIDRAQRGAATAELTFNFNNALVKKLAALKDRKRLKLAVEMLYVQALMMGHHPLRAQEMEALNRCMTGLIELGL